MSPLSHSEFMSMVATAVDELPGWVHETMDNVEVLIDDEPPDDEPGELLGLYQGVPLTERGDDYGALPDTITLFLGPIEREVRETGTSCAEVIAQTLRHEVAHHFGIDDDRLLDIDAY